jgi:cold shock CspA family protein
MEKSPKAAIRNSFIYNEDNWSSISMSENKNQKLPANLISLAKPINLSNDYNIVTKDIYQKTVPIKMKDLNRGEWKTDIIVKIQNKIDNNLQRNKLFLELTEEDNPLFLHTCEIGETEFHSIRQDQQIRVEFHKLADYLAELLNSCIKSHQGHEQNSTYECLLSTTKSNVATFTIEEHTRFKDISLIVLKFVNANDQDRLRFISNQVKDYKNQVANLTEQLDQK